jgi:hypothetical protein
MPITPILLFGWTAAIPPSRPAHSTAGARRGGQGSSRGTRPTGRDGRALRGPSPPAFWRQTDAGPLASDPLPNPNP